MGRKTSTDTASEEVIRKSDKDKRREKLERDRERKYGKEDKRSRRRR